MKEKDFLSSLVPPGQQGGAAAIPSLLRDGERLIADRLSRHHLESFIQRAGIPVPPIFYLALSISASFFVFLESLFLGPLAAVAAGVVSLCLTVFFLPSELFGRRIRLLHADLSLACHMVGTQMLDGASLDHSLTRCCERVKSNELRGLLRDAQRRLLISGGISGLRDEVSARGYGVIVSGFLAALQYSSTHQAHEAGTMCISFAQVLREEVSILRRHAISLGLARAVGLLGVAVAIFCAYASGFLTSPLPTGSTAALAREFGAITLLLALAALLRVTSLSDWERYGRL